MQADVRSFQERGYAIVSGLFSDDDVAAYREHYMQMRRKAPMLAAWICPATTR